MRRALSWIVGLCVFGLPLVFAGLAYRHVWRPQATLSLNGNPVQFDASGQASVTLPRRIYVGDLPTQLTYNLQLSNKLLSPIAIESVNASCGCTRPEFSTGILEPGQTVSGAVRITTNRKREDKQRSITITLVDGRQFIAQLPYSVYPKMSVSPSDHVIVMEGTTAMEVAARIDVSVFQRGPAHRPDLKLALSEPGINFRLRGPTSTQMRSHGQVREDVFSVEFQGESQQRTSGGVVIMKAMSSTGDIVDKDIPLVSQIQPPAVVTPTHVQFSRQYQSRYITIRRFDKEPIRAIQLSIDDVRCERVAAETGNGVAVLKVTPVPVKEQVDGGSERTLSADVRIDDLFHVCRKAFVFSVALAVCAGHAVHSLNSGSSVVHAQEFAAELRDCVDQENQVVDEDVVLGGPCAEPGSHCVEEPNQCVFIGLDDDKQYRKVVDRVKRSVCEEGSDPSEECKSCPEGARRVCARGEWYSGKDIVEGTCEDFFGTFIVLGGKCIPGGN